MRTPDPPGLAPERMPIASSKRLLQGLVQGVFTHSWTLGFRIKGRLQRTTIAPWRPAGGPALVLAPHPDDEVAGCAGALLAHRAAGEATTVTCISDGRLSRAFGLAPGAMAVRRQGEARAAAAILGAELDWCGLAEGDWSIDDTAALLADRLDHDGPARIYAPSRLDFHPEHRRVARALARALARTGTPAEVWIYPVHVPLTSSLTHAVLRVDAQRSAIVRAIEAHASQAGSLWRCLRMRRYAAAWSQTGNLAETFWPLSAADYVRLDRSVDDDDPPPEAVFFGMRYYAWSDPLSYLRGRRARSHARRSVE